MKLESGYYTWNKGEKEHINDYFNTVEFNCRCSYEDCQEQKISEDLINRLTFLREASKGPLRINSGFRCAKYQQQLRDEGVNTVVAKQSQHELGNAADVSSSPLQPLQLLQLAKLVFTSYGIARNFLHLDLRLPHPDGTPRVWYYYTPYP